MSNLFKSSNIFNIIYSSDCDILIDTVVYYAVHVIYQHQQVRQHAIYCLLYIRLYCEQCILIARCVCMLVDPLWCDLRCCSQTVVVLKLQRTPAFYKIGGG